MALMTPDRNGALPDYELDPLKRPRAPREPIPGSTLAAVEDLMGELARDVVMTLVPNRAARRLRCRHCSWTWVVTDYQITTAPVEALRLLFRCANELCPTRRRSDGQ